jgi:hypothetical protein
MEVEVTRRESRSTGTTGTTGTSSQTYAGEFGRKNGQNGHQAEGKFPAGAGTSPGSPVVPGPAADTDPARWVRDLLQALGSARHGKKLQCPAHGLTGEHTVSLSVETGDHGRCLIYCHAGCTWRDVLRALKLPPSALTVRPPTPPARHARAYLPRIAFPPPKAGGGSAPERGFRFESEHPYGDDVWLVRLRHPSGAKEITWESRNPHGERVPGLLGRRTRDLPLYREREVRMAVAAYETVVVVESESSVDALRKAGLYACTWAGGAGAPNTDRLAGVLAHAENVVIVPDMDAAGIECLAKIRPVLPSARVVVGDEGEDARDLLVRIGPDAFRNRITEALR